MLPKVNRLPAVRISEIIQLRQGKSFNGIRLWCQPNGLRNSRFAFIVPHAADKRASVRNRVKRLLREAINDNLKHIAAGWDVICLAEKRKIATQDIQNVPTACLNCLLKSGLWVGEERRVV